MDRKSGARLDESRNRKPEIANHRDRWRVPVEHPDRFEPVHAGHENVDDDHVELLVLDGRDGAAPVLGGRDVVPSTLQHRLDDVAYALVVIDNENP